MRCGVNRRCRRVPQRARRGFSLITCVLSAVSISLGCTSREAQEVVQISGGGTCLYSGHRIDRLETFGAAIGRPFACAVVFNNAAPDWDDLVDPWFLTHRDPNLNWAAWKRAEPSRQLVISQALVPDDAPPDWRARGAVGEHEDFARTLAANLVANGLGDSVIRLAHESNGPWAKDGVGPDSSQYAAWRESWRRFATAMKSVTGARFEFDWTVNPGVKPIAFEEYYPGDDVVDIIGVDIYDFWETTRLGPAPDDLQTRWDVRFEEPGGVGELLSFAESRRKPLSIPEWGLSTTQFQGGLGDNPSFVEEVVRLIDDHDVSYHAYFAKSPDTLLVDWPRSFDVYRVAFGGLDGTTGVAVPDDRSPQARQRAKPDQEELGHGDHNSGP
jgi:hypothetical protein